MAKAAKRPSRRRRSAPPDTVAQGEYHFLDVGDEKYGECILVVFGGVRVLFDGSHQGDFRGRNGHKSIPAQLAEILAEEPPHRISLLVVTHGHADHIGCLPDLANADIIRADWAFITDPKWGFGRTASDEVPQDAMSNPAQRLVAALREEDASDLNDEDLAAFIDAAASVETRYATFIQQLRNSGTTVEIYRGQSLPAKLKQVLKPTGAMLLGPSEAQLLHCAEQISKTNAGAEDAARQLLQVDDAMDDVALYRAVTGQALVADASSNPRGNGMNCQSITFAFGPKNARVLLAGDMQFAEPGVAGADAEVTKLRKRVAKAGPYKVFKTTHHSSHNGQDDDFLTELGNPSIIVHSGGLNDAAHPFPGVLQVLKDRRSDIEFARTDRNGHITIRPHLDGLAAISKSGGRLNDFSDNARDGEATALTAAAMPAVGAGPASAQIIVINLPTGPVNMSVGGVEIVVHVGDGLRSTAASPSAANEDPRSSSLRPRRAAISLAAGRVLPRLLFVTNVPALAANIGQAEAAQAVDAVRQAGHPVCEVGATAMQAVSTVQAKLAATPAIRGVVILGGYDVVPCNVVDVLSPALRTTLGRAVVEVDDDHFMVWSDELYGDTDGDRIGEIAVSRIPDGRDAALLFNALGCQAASEALPQRFGVRNVARPFAANVWKRLAGSRSMNISEPFLGSKVAQNDLAATLHYFMLHGDWHDGRTFYGEFANQNGYTDAFVVGGVPKQFGGLVFAGCCWGALTVSQKARDAGAAPIAPRVVERSIALSYLKAGASAFVGCTGSHYSGADPNPEANYAAPLHSSFWTALPKQGFSGAMALLKARGEYSAFVASRAIGMDPLDLARRMKNRAQFTCLGLGW